jgi:lipopolysaccharide transport system permease protein
MRLIPVWARTAVPLAWAELRQRYAGSLLGAAWAVAEPLLEVLAYVLVFGFVLRFTTGLERWRIALVVASGVLPWSALRLSLDGCARLLADNRWIRRSTVPFEPLVARQALVCAVRALAGLVLVGLASVAYGARLGPAEVLLPLVALYCQTVAAYGLGLALAPLGALLPDLRPGLASALTLLTFASPVVYVEHGLPPSVLAALEWNPYTHYLRLYRLLISPEAGQVTAAGLITVLATPALCLAAGSLVKRRWLSAARDRL